MTEAKQIFAGNVSCTVVEAISDPECWKGYQDPIVAARQCRTAVKVVVALKDRNLHVAFGFPDDDHIAIGDRTFAAALGTDWSVQADECGGGEITLDFASDTVEITGKSHTLSGRAVPSNLTGAVVREVRKLIN